VPGARRVLLPVLVLRVAEGPKVPRVPPGSRESSEIRRFCARVRPQKSPPPPRFALRRASQVAGGVLAHWASMTLRLHPGQSPVAPPQA